MNASRLAYVAIVVLTTLAASQQVFAQATHPALRGEKPAAATIDPNTFIVAHPAGLALRGGHANHAHPAEQARQNAAVLDTNHFLVQPPSSVHWVAAPEAELTVAAAR